MTPKLALVATILRSLGLVFQAAAPFVPDQLSVWAECISAIFLALARGLDGH